MNTEYFEKLHRIAFSTPRLLTSTTLLILSSMLIYILNLKILNFLSFAIILAILIPLLKTKFEIARYTFFITFISISVILSDTISRFLNTFPNGIFVAFVTITVLYFMSESGIVKTSISSTILSLLFFPKPITVLGIFLGILFIFLMNKEFYGYNLRECFKSFLLSWLTNDPKYFEKVLIDRAVEVEGIVRCLNIGRARIVTTSFHPGPLRNIGGAKLVEMINSLENTFYLHSPTDHSLNPASVRDVMKIVSSIKCSEKKLNPMKPFEIDGENYILTVFPFDKLRLIFVSGKECIDDLPREINVRDAIIIDAHNAHCKKFEPNVDELKSLIERSLNIETEYCNLRYFFKKFDIETNSICGSFTILVLDYNFEKFAIIVFDGNNVKLEFRKEIERFCKERGFKAIVVSTDNHSKTVITTKFTYLPVGSDDRDRVVFKYLEECLNKKTEECEVFFGEKKVSVKVVGENFCKFVDRAGIYGIKITFTYISLLVASFILSTII